MKQGWEVKKFNDVLEILNGKNQKFVQSEDGKYPIFGSAGNVMGYATDYICKEGTTIIGRKGTINNPIFMATKFWNVDTAFGLYAKNCLDKKFLYYYCISYDFSLHNRGTTIPSLVKTDLLQIEIPLPQLPEQKRIVMILDAAFEAINQAKENAEQNLKNAQELFKSYLQNVFETKGEDWEEKMLKEIGIAQTGTTPKTSDKANYGNFIPFIKPADIDIIGNGEIRYDNDGLSEQGLCNGRKMPSGSILMVCIGATIGKVGFVNRDVSCNQQINSLTVKKEFSPKFIYYALSTKSFFDQVINNSAQATLPIINKGKWETLTVNYPKSLAEQQAIVTKLDALSVQTKKLERLYEQKLADLEELKKSILHKAFNGEL